MSCIEEINYSLISAVRTGNLRRTRELINRYGLSYSAAWANGYVLLREAVKRNYTAIAELLLASGSKVNSKNSSINPTDTPLHFAVSKANLEIARLLLERGANVNARNFDGSTPLHNAIKNRCLPTVYLLLNHGACVHSKTDEGYMPIHYASQGDNEETVKLLLNRNADVNALTNSNLSPLQIACNANKTTVINILLQNGAKVDYQDWNGRTVLNLAVKEGKLMIVEGILKYCPDINNQSNRDSLKIAVLSGGEQYKTIVHKLLSYGFTLSPEDANNSTILHIAVEKGYLKIVESLLKNHADVNTLSNSPSQEGFTLLHTAAKNKQEEIAKLLIVNGADVNAQDKIGKTPILYAIENLDLQITNLLLTNKADIKSNNLLNIAVKKGCVEIVAALLLHGADINARDEYGRTALHYTVLLKIDSSSQEGFTLLHSTAAKNKQEEIAKLLIVNGADVNAQDTKGKTPILYAIENIDLQITNLLLTNKADIKSNTLLNIAVKKGCVEIIAALLLHGADINASDEYGRTALHYTALNEKAHDLYSIRFSNKDLMYMNKRGEVAKLLLREGADVDAQTKTGITTLMAAVLNGYTTVVEALLEYNPNTNVVYQNHETLLHVSAGKGFPEICKLLLDKGVNVDSKSKDGITALVTAILKGHSEVVRLLLESSANVNYNMKNDLTPLHVAASEGHEKIVEDLLKFGADVDSRGNDGRTPLHIASSKGHDQVVKTLLRFGSDINIMCRQNLTPVHCAIHTLRSQQNKHYKGYRSGNDVILCKRIIKYLGIHIIKMKNANLYIRKEIKFKFLAKLFEVKCKQEIILLKRAYVADSNITFYDLLTKSASSLAVYLRNENLVQVLKSDNYKIEFPIYADIIEGNYRKAIKKQGLIEELDNNCDLFNNCIKLPYNCIENILSYLSNEDLRLLLEAHKLPLK